MERQWVQHWAAQSEKVMAQMKDRQMAALTGFH
jgi:hypothetical protein